MRAVKLTTPHEGEEDVEQLPVVSHKYRCVLRLDSGGMAEVFLAVSRGVAGFNKLVVLKRLRESLADNADHREMFLHEARLAARLNHPNVVQTHEVGEDDEGIFIAMEYLEGQPLSRLRRELVKQERELSLGILVRIASEVLAGLHYAHELADYDGTPLRIVHRDVSPQNVFVTYDGQVKLVDFGIAKTHDSGTQAGIFKGKFAYTSPEQIRGEGIDRRADIFTAGILLWELLTGHKLLDGNNPAQTFARLLNHAMPTVRSIAPAVDERLDAIVMRALERNPALRYQTAQAMRDALEEYLVASGHAVRHDQLAQIVGELFRAERARVQNAIKEELAGLARAAGRDPASSSRVIAAKRLSLGDESVSMQASTPAMTRSAVTRSEPPELELVSETRKRAHLRYGAWALSGVALAAVLYAVTRPRAPTPPTPTPVEPAAASPLASPAPPPVTATVAPAPPPAPAEPEEAPSAKNKWMPRAKKTTSAASQTTSAPTPPPPAPPPATEPSSKEKRKFRVEL